MDAMISDPSLAMSVERAFEKQPLAGTLDQVTPRSVVIAVVLSIVFGFVSLKLQMTAGVLPSLNMPITVLSYIFLKWFVGLLRTCGLPAPPCTRQETVLIVTTVITVGNLAITGGFALYITSMTSVVATSLGEEHPDPKNIVDNFPTGQWMLFLFLVGLMGIFTSVPLNQVMILDYRLLFPTGTAQAHLINSFHTPQGAYLAKMQVASIFKFFIGSFSWAAFSWLYTAGKDCGFSSFPLFGLELYKHRFFFDFSATYIGVGMMVPPMVNISFLSGGMVSWGILFPFLESKNGIWYNASPTSLSGLNGYKIFITVALIVTDGLYTLIMLLITAYNDYRLKRQETDSVVANYLKRHPSLNYDDRKRIEVFLENRIPVSIPVVGYIICATICAVIIPNLFSQISFYHVITIYTIIPMAAVTNTYVAGLTDWNVAYTYAKFTIFIVAAWVAKPGAIVAGLVACGIVVTSLYISSLTTMDIKTGYMTLTSQRAMVFMQIVGITIGSVITPCIFRAFQRSGKAHVPIGSADSAYPCPYAGLYRAIGMIGSAGVDALPKHCLKFCFAAACFAIAINTISLLSQRKGWAIQAYIPSVTVFALPFTIGSAVGIDLCIGSVVMFIWTKMNVQSAVLLSAAVASGLMCGEGLFTFPSALLSLYSVEPPMCMKFIHSGKQVDLTESFFRNMGTSTKP